MVDVVGVHGIAQQQGGRHQLLEAWRPALHDGVERARGLEWPKPSLDLVYYGDLYLAATGMKGPGDPGPPSSDPEPEIGGQVTNYANANSISGATVRSNSRTESRT